MVDLFLEAINKFRFRACYPRSPGKFHVARTIIIKKVRGSSSSPDSISRPNFSPAFVSTALADDSPRLLFFPPFRPFPPPPLRSLAHAGAISPSCFRPPYNFVAPLLLSPVIPLKLRMSAEALTVPLYQVSASLCRLLRGLLFTFLFKLTFSTMRGLPFSERDANENNRVLRNIEFPLFLVKHGYFISDFITRRFCPVTLSTSAPLSFDFPIFQLSIGECKSFATSNPELSDSHFMN